MFYLYPMSNRFIDIDTFRIKVKKMPFHISILQKYLPENTFRYNPWLLYNIVKYTSIKEFFATINWKACFQIFIYNYHGLKKIKAHYTIQIHITFSIFHDFSKLIYNMKATNLNIYNNMDVIWRFILCFRNEDIKQSHFIIIC